MTLAPASPHARRANTGAAVEYRGVARAFGGRPAVHPLDVDVPAGCVFGFLGRNGAGKTTLMRMTVGIVEPDAGSVRVLGAGDPASLRRRVGYLPEERGLYRRMRCRDFVAWIGRLKGLSRREAGVAADGLLARFGLADRARDRCQSLSKGLAQKLQIASVLVHSPSLVILDEPFSGLDPVNVDLVRGLIRELRAEGRTVILSTHQMAEAEALCDELLLLDHGHARLQGALDALLRGDDTALVAELAGPDPVDVRIAGRPEFRDVVQAGRELRVRTHPGVAPADAVRALIAEAPVVAVRAGRRSLHDLFVETVGHEPDPDAGGSS